MALARCACEATRRPGRAGDALCAGDGGGLHAQPGEDRDGAPRAGSLLTMANTTRVVMPQLGESVHEGTISRWLVKPGDKVVEFEPLLEVDTDKVSAEVPSPVTGVLREILAKEGQTVQAGAEIAVVEVGADGKVTGAPESPAPAPEASSRGSAAGTPADAAPFSVEKHATVEATELEGGEHRYSPAVQMLASELKVDLSQIPGTGLGGRITKKDVQEFATRAKSAPAAGPVNHADQPSAGDEVIQL